MKKVFLLIVLACLFTGCKGEVAGGQENNQQELLPNQIKIINNSEGLVLERFTILFVSNPNKGTIMRDVDFLDKPLYYGETVVIEIPNCVKGYHASKISTKISFVWGNKQGGGNGSGYNKMDDFYYLDNDGEYRITNSKKTVLFPSDYETKRQFSVILN